MESPGRSTPTSPEPGLIHVLWAPHSAVHNFRSLSWGLETWVCVGLGSPCFAPSQGLRAEGDARWEAQGREAGPGRLGGSTRQAAMAHWCLSAPCPPVQDIVFQLQRFVSTMSKYYNDCYAVLRDADVFPIEVDLAHTTLAYGLSQDEFTDGEEEEEEDDEDTAAGETSRDARGAAGPPLDKGGSWCDS